MKKVLLLALILFMFACTQPGPSPANPGGDYIPGAAGGDYPANGIDEYPSISISASPTSLSREEPFTLTISSEDDQGVQKLVFESSHIFWNHEKEGEFDCNLQDTCSNSWDLITWEQGLYVINAYAIDSAGKQSGAVSIEISVGPYKGEEAGGAEAEAEGADSARSTSTSNNWYIAPTCGNDVCENGESYLNCEADCLASETIGTQSANGYCEPGESKENAPKDCTTIHATCGNNVCDSGEDRLSCYYDCKNGAGTSDGSSCNTNSDCSYEQRCKREKCVKVECTTPSNCGTCQTCTDNQCVSCGSGPYGCYC